MESTKIPTMLWKTQLLDLVNEAPKAHCVECTGISTNHRFFSCPPSASGTASVDGGSESDLSSHSVGLSHNGIELDGPEHIHEFEPVIRTSREHVSIEKLTQLIQVNLQVVDSDAIEVDLNKREQDGKGGLPSYATHFSNTSVPPRNKMGNEESIQRNENLLYADRRPSCKTAAAPWHRPSIYYFNPFSSAFHGNLSRPNVKRLLTVDGNFLVRKRMEDGDDEFVLSVKFNGRVKNFMITFDDTSGLIYLQNREKGFEHLEDLVQEGLVTMYVEHKAGPYIDLLYDLTRNEHNRIGESSKYLDSLSPKTKGGTFTADCIYEFFESNKQSDTAIRPHRFGQSQKKQNSPSPVSSLSGSSLERVRQPDLKSHSFKTHTFQQLSKCHICRNFLWGLSSQGLLCKHCGLIIHETCIAKVHQECEPDLAKLPTVFGLSLTLLVKATPGSGPPFLLQKCISEIDKRGLLVEGIYRVSGSREATERLKNVLERDRDSAELAGHTDIHSMCSIVKLFLRQLPESLISEEVFHTFLNNNVQVGNNTPTTATEYNRAPNIMVDSVRRELKKLPPAHYITLKYLLQHLHRVAQRSEHNKMNPFNLSSVFAPSLLCPSQMSIETPIYHFRYWVRSGLDYFGPKDVTIYVPGTNWVRSPLAVLSPHWWYQERPRQGHAGRY